MTNASARCGAKHPKNREVCTRDAGHVGMHHNGGNVTWKQAKPPAEATSPEAALDAVLTPVNQTPAERVYSIIAAKPGQTAQQIGGRRYAKAIGELEAAGRIEWRDDGWWPAEQQAKPAPMTLEDEPEDPEADAAAIAAMDAQDEDDDPYEDEIRSDEDRALARKLREDREAHAAELDAEEPAAAAAQAQGGTVFRGVMVGMRRRDIKVHPAADALPLIEGKDFDDMVEDIKANGLRIPPVLDSTGEWLVDGRNRMRACEKLGIDPTFTTLDEGEDIFAFVWSINIPRRHMDEGQRGLVAARWADMPRGRPSKTGPGDRISQQEAARRMQVSDRTVRRAKAVLEKGAPEVIKAVEQGRVDITAAAELAKLPAKKQREIIERETASTKGQVRGGRIRALAKQEEKREVVRKINNEQVAPAPVGPFRVIVVDWPWPYDNSDQHEGSRGHIPYPAMLIEQGIAMAPEIDKLAHAAGCVLGFWTTNAFMPDAVRLVEAWSFTWRTIYTWDKGRDGIGTWGRGRTEHLVIASRGEVTHTLNEISTLLSAPRREHSRKPDEAMVIFEAHCPGPRVELFSREPRFGWAAWGAETSKFATEAA